jgi:hypothetical protein
MSGREEVMFLTTTEQHLLWCDVATHQDVDHRTTSAVVRGVYVATHHHRGFFFKKRQWRRGNMACNKCLNDITVTDYLSGNISNR